MAKKSALQKKMETMREIMQRSKIALQTANNALFNVDKKENDTINTEGFISSKALAEAIEHYFKAAAIYFNIGQAENIPYNQKISQIDSLISSPKKMVEKMISSEEAENYDQDGHNIRELFELQSDLIKFFIRHESIRSDGIEKFNYLDYLLLTNGSIYDGSDIVQNMKDLLHENSRNFPIHRYPYTNQVFQIIKDKKFTPQDLKFLFEYSYSLSNIMNYFLDVPDNFLDSSNNKDDAITYQNNFLEKLLDTSEINEKIKTIILNLPLKTLYTISNYYGLKDYYTLINVLSNMEIPQDKSQEDLISNFINLSSYMKYQSITSGYDIDFDIEVLKNIWKHCQIVQNADVLEEEYLSLKQRTEIQQLKPLAIEEMKINKLSRQIKEANAKLIIGNEDRNEILANKVPIVITGASKSSWPAIGNLDQAYIQLTMQVLANVLDPEKAYLVTGGTNFGVEKAMHEAVNRRNSKSNNKLLVLGTLTMETLNSGTVEVESNTITHAIILEDENGNKTQNWEDLPNFQLKHIKDKKGEMIAVGGGAIVSKMIVTGNENNISMHLMNGPDGASTDIIDDPNFGYDENKYELDSFETIQSLLTRLYNNKNQSKLFIDTFDINKISEYIFQSLVELKKVNVLDEKKMKQLLRRLNNTGLELNFNEVNNLGRAR